MPLKIRATAPEWTAGELAELADLQSRNDVLPEDAPRGLLSVRLSILTEDTTSPARQELDLRRYAIREGIRVVGVARDLGRMAFTVRGCRFRLLGALTRAENGVALEGS